MIEILRVLVGSRAHGLHGPGSDFDYRSVFVVPTSEIVCLNPDYKETSWIEGKTKDDIGWELKHFLIMCVKGNPSALETFVAPVVMSSSIGNKLLSLFPVIWNSKDVHDSFIGYGENQRTKFLARKDDRPHKYAVAYLRTLYNAWELLTTGKMTCNVASTPVGPTLKRWKEEIFTVGEVMDTCAQWTVEVDEAYKANPDKQTDLCAVDDFLKAVRHIYWKDYPSADRHLTS